MLRWCSYCQQFLGEVPNYDDLAITHGICASCKPRALDFADADIRSAEVLRGVQGRLFEAGIAQDLEAAKQIIDEAMTVGVRGADMLIGMIAPLLCRIGEDWQRGVVTVAQEHRFTRFCEQVVELVAAETSAINSATMAEGAEADVLLMNAPGSRHTLAIRILALWLTNHGLRVKTVAEAPDVDALPALVTSTQPKLLLISMALAEQLASVASLAERAAQLPTSVRPKIIVGGNAVKRGHVSAIPHAKLLADISLLGPSAV